MTGLAFGAIGLGLLYSLTLASSDPVDFATGVLLGGTLMSVLAKHRPIRAEESVTTLALRLAWFGIFAAAVLGDVVRGTWDVTLRVMHLRDVERPGIVRVPIGDRSERGAAISALATTLSPGSVLLDIDWERRDLLLHVIDASDPDGVRSRHQRFYERYQRRVFP